MPEPQVDNFEFYIVAFYELSSCRNYGMGLGPIPFTAIAEYCKIYEVDDIAEFTYFIRLMDKEFIKGQNAKQTNSKKHNSKGKANR